MALTHSDHLRLLSGGVPPGGTWADLGSGRGSFTLALAELLGPAGELHSVDRDGAGLEVQIREISPRIPGKLNIHNADFTKRLHFPPLDGVVMANSLHFVRDKAPVLELVGGYLKLGGRLVLIEYDSDRGNPWVPFPLSFATWQRVAPASGFSTPQLLASVPSSVLGRIYSALSLRSSESSSA